MMLIAEYEPETLSFFGGVPWTDQSDQAIDALIKWRNTVRDWLRTHYNPEDRPPEEYGKPVTWRYQSSINPLGSNFPRVGTMSLADARKYGKALAILLATGTAARDEARLTLYHEDKTMRKRAALERLTESATEHVNSGYVGKEDRAEGRSTDDFYFKKLGEVIRFAKSRFKNPTQAELEQEELFIALEEDRLLQEEKDKRIRERLKEEKRRDKEERSTKTFQTEPTKEGETILPYVVGAGALAVILWMIW